MRSDTHDDIGHIVFLNLGGQIDIDLNPVLGILFFNSMKQRMEPLCTSEITDDPSEVYLPMMSSAYSAL